MIRIQNTVAIAVVLALGCVAISQAQIPEMAKPSKEHKLLEQFAGDWKMTAEAEPAPGQPPIKCEGSETAKMLGGFWLISEGQGDMMGTPVNSRLTIGYDPAKKKYIGTFCCTMDSTLWTYEGKMDETGKKLTLETEGPMPMDPSKKCKFREVLELQDPDHKTFTSYIQGEDGKEVKMVEMKYERKK